MKRAPKTPSTTRDGAHAVIQLKTVWLTVALTLILAVPVLAQESGPPQAVKRGPGTYAHLFTIEFKPGKTDEGVELLEKYLIPAWKSAGVEVTMMESLIGEKNVMLLIPLKDGPEYFEWTIPAQDAKAWAALSKQVGADKSEQVVDKFVGLLVRQSEDFVFLPAGEKAGKTD